MPDQPHDPESPWGREPPTGGEWTAYDPIRTSPVGEPGPGRGGRAVLVTLLVVGVLVVVGIVATVVVLAGDDDATPSAAPTTSSRPAEPASSAPSSSAPSSSAPSSSAPPTEDTGPVDPDSPFSYTEYGDDWDFKIGSVALQATFQQGWDYPDCTSVEVGDALTSIGCVRASEWTLRALDDQLAMTHIVLTFDSPADAKQAVVAGLIDSAAFTVEPDGLLGGDASTGTFKADNVTNMPFVVLTVETHDPVVRQAKADQFRAYGTADIVAALGFRF